MLNAINDNILIVHVHMLAMDYVIEITE